MKNRHKGILVPDSSFFLLLEEEKEHWLIGCQCHQLKEAAALDILRTNFQRFRTWRSIKDEIPLPMSVHLQHSSSGLLDFVQSVALFSSAFPTSPPPSLLQNSISRCISEALRPERSSSLCVYYSFLLRKERSGIKKEGMSGKKRKEEGTLSSSAASSINGTRGEKEEMARIRQVEALPV